MVDPLGIGPPCFSITGAMYKRLVRMPIVYAWIRDGVALYIGVGTKGIDRPLSAGHHVLTPGRVHADDSFMFWEAKSRPEALRLECELIRRFRPKFNRLVEDVARDSPRRDKYGLWRRDNSWVVEFIHHHVRYKKSLGTNIPLSLARKLALEYRLSVLVKTMPEIQDRPINGYQIDSNKRKVRPVLESALIAPTT